MRTIPPIPLLRKKIPPKKFIILLCGIVLLSFIFLNRSFGFFAGSKQNAGRSLKDSPYPYGGTLVWGTTNPPSIINPVLTQHSVSAALMALVFDSLVRLNGKGEIVPGLAESWDVSEDGLEYTFYLKQGVRFHDGVELTAQDVKFTYDAVADPKNNSPWRTKIDLIEGWKVIDKHTLVMKLDKPFPAVFNNLVREIAPRHLLENQDLASTPFNIHPVGSGPFRFKSWDRETDQIELSANLDYFEGRPYLDKIIIKTYSDNSQLWTAFMRAEVDFVKLINKEDYLVLKQDPTFKTYKIPTDMYWAMVYNLKDPELYDVEVRKAIARAINLNELMKAVSTGGTESIGPLSSESIGFNPDVKAFSYDPVRAQMDLMHRGWTDRDNDGILDKAGRELEIGLLVDIRSEYYKKMALIIRQQLYGIGVKIRIIPYQDENELNEEFLRNNNIKAWLRFYQGFGNDPFDALASWYSLATQTAQLWAYKNQEIDHLFEEGKITRNIQERSEICQKIYKIIYEAQPACFLFFPVTYHAVASKFENTEAFFSNYMPVHTIKEWYIKGKDFIGKNASK